MLYSKLTTKLLDAPRKKPAPYYSSIFMRITEVEMLPSVQEFAYNVQLGLDTGVRLHKLAKLDLAAKILRAQQAGIDMTHATTPAEVLKAEALVKESDQTVLDATDFTAAMGTWASDQRTTMAIGDEFSERLSISQTIQLGLFKVFITLHPPTIGHILTKVDLNKLTIAARSHLELTRLLAIIDALMNAIEEDDVS